jgi:hypothetical protein
MSEVVNASFPTDTNPVKLSYRFNKDDVGNQRAKVELENVQVLSLNGIKAILEKPTTCPETAADEVKAECAANKAEQDLLLEAVLGVYKDVIKDWVGTSEDNNAKTFKQEKFTWRAIATMPKEDRRSSAFPKELWEAFIKDYTEVMQVVANRSKDVINNQCQVFLKKFSLIKTNKTLLKFLQMELAVYVEHTKQGDQFADLLEFLLKKVETLLEDKDTEAMLGNLGM